MNNFKNKVLFIVFSIVLLLIVSCNPNLTRNKLDLENQLFWNYYHSVDYCRRIELFEFITKDKYMESWLSRKQSVVKHVYKGRECNDGVCYFPYTEDNMFDYKKMSNYYEFKSLYDDKRNSFYGYIYHDIKNKSKDKINLCRGLVVNGSYYTKYLESERPPEVFTYKKFEDALLRWRKACGCDTTQN